MTLSNLGRNPKFAEVEISNPVRFKGSCQVALTELRSKSAQRQVTNIQKCCHTSLEKLVYECSHGLSAVADCEENSSLCYNFFRF